MAIHTNTFLIYFQEKAEKDKKSTNKAKLGGFHTEPTDLALSNDLIPMHTLSVQKRIEIIYSQCKHKKNQHINQQ